MKIYPHQLKQYKRLNVLTKKSLFFIGKVEVSLGLCRNGEKAMIYEKFRSTLFKDLLGLINPINYGMNRFLCRTKILPFIL